MSISHILAVLFFLHEMVLERGWLTLITVVHTSTHGYMVMYSVTQVSTAAFGWDAGFKDICTEDVSFIFVFLYKKISFFIPSKKHFDTNKTTYFPGKYRG